MAHFTLEGQESNDGGLLGHLILIKLYLIEPLAIKQLSLHLVHLTQFICFVVEGWSAALGLALVRKITGVFVLGLRES